MKTIKFKTSREGQATLQHPNAKLGVSGDVITYEVTDIPQATTHSEVHRLFNSTTIASRTCFSVPFSELGVGRIYFGKTITLKSNLADLFNRKINAPV